MCDEIAVLKGEKARPMFKPSKMQESTDKTDAPSDSASSKEGLKITDARHVRIAIAGALLVKGFNPELAIASDGASQFIVGLHALCWVHAERLIHKLILINDAQRQAVPRVRGQLWDLYADLKAYKRQPSAEKVAPLQARFDAWFTQSNDYYTLDDLLVHLNRRKEELLLVSKRPDIPLHTNGNETYIRGFVKKRKISGGTRNDLGRKCRDIFASLKKTCRKLGIFFWSYLLDRVSLSDAIPPQPILIREAAIARALPMVIEKLQLTYTKWQVCQLGLNQMGAARTGPQCSGSNTRLPSLNPQDESPTDLVMS